MLEPHKLSDVFSEHHVGVLTSGEEGESVLLAICTEVPFFDLFFVRLHAAGQSSRVADALLESAEVTIHRIKGVLHVPCLVMDPLDVAPFLAVQKPDDELVNGVIPVHISTIFFIAKLGVERLFPCYFEVSVEHLIEL